MTTPAAWHSDPAQRHQYRYWDGAAWTAHVADGGTAGIDAIPGAIESAASFAESEPTFAAPTPVVIQPLQAIRGIARALAVMLWICIALAGLAAGAFANRISVVSDIQSVGFTDPGAARDADDYVQATSIALLVSSLVVLVLLIVWMWRVAKNAAALGRTNPRFKPGWTIGGWFVPLANLVIPAGVMVDLWKGSDPASPPGDPQWRKQPRSPFIVAWWAAWIGASLLRFAVRPGDQDSLNYADQLKRSDTADLIAMVLTMIAGFLLIVIVRGITDRQSRLADTAAVSGPTPAVP